jgi:hypothetical protein
LGPVATIASMYSVDDGCVAAFDKAARFSI